MQKIVITTTSFGKYDKKPLDILEENGCAINLNPYGRKLKEEEVIALCKDAIGIIAGTEPLNADALEKLSNLKVISRCGTGLDNVDLDAAKRLRIKIYNTPDAPILAVAELTIGLILDLLRKTTLMDKDLRKGVWKKHMGNLLSGKKVGIIGFGRIGQKVTELLTPFGVTISYYDICSKETSLCCSPKQMDDLLQWADIITLHCAALKGAKKMIGAKELKRMKKGAWLINTSRGGLVDEDALADALKGNHLSGAALDVYEKEPYAGPLAEINNVILTPHIGSYAIESRVKMEMQAVTNLLDGLKNQ